MEKSAQQYLAFVLGEEWVSAAIWQLVGGNITILNQSRTVPYHSEQATEITNALDAALDDLGEAGISIKSVLFILPRSWIQENDLHTEKKRLLKSLAQDLVLDPMGFVVIADSLAAAETAKTGQSFTGVILSNTTNFWDLVVYDQGEEQRSERIGKSGDSQADVTELQARLHGLTVPRWLFLRTPAEDSSHEEQLLEKALKTSIEIFTPEQIREVSLKAGGKEVLGEQPVDQPLAQAVDQPTPDPDTVAIPDDDFAPPSFLQGGHQAEKPHTIIPETHHDDLPLMNVNPNTGTQPRFQVPQPLETEVDGLEAVAGEDVPDYLQKPASPKRSLKLPPIQWSALASLWNKVQRQLRTSSKARLAVGAAVLGVFLILGGTAFAVRQQSRAEITLWLAGETLTTEKDFLLAQSAIGPNASSSPVLVASTFTETVTQSTETPTTGTKITGDPAKGTVELFNKTSQEKSFPKGTKIFKGSLAFTLDSDVKVASASTKEGSGSRTTTYGSAEVAVTAVDIGIAGNLDKDQQFTVANFDLSSYEAKNKKAFEGGTSREIQAVAQKDVDQTVANLTKTGTDELREKILGSASDTDVVLFTESVKVKETQLSAKVGEEAKFVNITVILEGTGIRIATDTLQESALSLLSDQVSGELQLLPETVRLQPGELKVNAQGNYVLHGMLEAKAVPQVNATDIAERIKGEYAPRAEVLLREDTRFSRVEIIRHPNWAQWFLTKLPKNTERLQLNIRINNE